MRRAAVASALALLALLSTAPPAVAHTVTGVEPTNYASRILYVRPALPGLTVRLLDLGRRVELKNRSDEEVVVVGYQGEPYLKVGPAGAFENRRSKTTYDNRPTVGTATTASTTAPARLDPAAPPSWRRIGGAPVLRWRDQRTRYEGPPQSGTSRRVMSQWTIELRGGEEPVRIGGLITYIPAPAPLPWVALTIALVALTAAAAWSKRWGRWLGVALAVLLASDVIHSFGTAAATHDPLGAQLVRVLLAGMVTTVAWIIGAVSIPSLQRNHEGGLVAAGGVGLVIAVFGGVTDTGVFGRSQVATVFPAVTARVSVALALGLGVGLILAVILVIARDPSLRPVVATRSDGSVR